MNKKNNFKGFLAVLLLLWNFGTSQITVGSTHPPARATIFDVKDKLADYASGDLVTGIKGGLGLPRVELQARDNLRPFIDETTLTPAEWAEQKALHTGLILYNLSTVGNDLGPGLYLWNGSEWETVRSGQSIPCYIGGNIDQDCDGLDNFIDIEDTDPCSPNLQVGLEYLDNGVTNVVPGSKEIRVLQGHEVLLKAKMIIGDAKKYRWSTGNNQNFITLNTDVVDATGKNYFVMVNNCSVEDQGTSTVKVFVDPNPCYLKLGGGGTTQLLDLGLGSNPFSPISIQSSNNITVTVTSTDFGAGQGVVIQGNNTTNVTLAKGTYPSTSGSIKLSVKASGCSTEEERTITIVYGDKAPVIETKLINYSHKYSYGSAPQNLLSNRGDFTVGLELKLNGEYAKKKGLLVRRFTGSVPAMPVPISGGSANLLGGTNMTGFVDETTDSNGTSTILDLYSTTLGNRALVMAYVQGTDGLYYYGTPRYVSACEYNFTDLRHCTFAGDRVNDWGMGGTARTSWAQWNARISPERAGDGYRRDGQNKGTYYVTNIKEYESRTTLGTYKWWFTENLRYEYPGWAYGTEYTAPAQQVGSSSTNRPFVTNINNANELQMAEAYGYLYKGSTDGSWNSAFCPVGWRMTYEKEGGGTILDWTKMFRTVMNDQSIASPTTSGSISVSVARLKAADPLAVNTNGGHGTWDNPINAANNTRENWLGLSIKPAGSAISPSGRANQGLQPHFWMDGLGADNYLFTYQYVNIVVYQISAQNVLANYYHAIRCVR